MLINVFVAGYSFFCGGALSSSGWLCSRSWLAVFLLRPPKCATLQACATMPAFCGTEDGIQGFVHTRLACQLYHSAQLHLQPRNFYFSIIFISNSSVIIDCYVIIRESFLCGKMYTQRRYANSLFYFNKVIVSLLYLSLFTAFIYLSIYFFWDLVLLFILGWPWTPDVA